MEPEISTLSNIREKVGHRQERIVLKILLVKQKITFLFVTGKGKNTKQNKSNQRALGASSFISWLKFILISWTC